MLIFKLLEVEYIYPRIKKCFFLRLILNAFTASNNRHPLLNELLWNVSLFAEEIKILFGKFLLTVKIKYKISSCGIL